MHILDVFFATTITAVYLQTQMTVVPCTCTPPVFLGGPAICVLRKCRHLETSVGNQGRPTTLHFCHSFHISSWADGRIFFTCHIPTINTCQIRHNGMFLPHMFLDVLQGITPIFLLVPTVFTIIVCAIMKEKSTMDCAIVVPHAAFISYFVCTPLQPRLFLEVATTVVCIVSMHSTLVYL